MYFKTDGTPPEEQHTPVVELLTPEDNTTVVDGSPVFTWSPVEGVNDYEFTLAMDQQLNDIIVRKSVSSTTYIHTSPLDPGKTYYWQVKANSVAVSPVHRFTIENQVAPPEEAPAEDTSPVLWIAGVVVLFLIVVVLTILLLRRRPSHSG
jgi:hypothetical protein